MRIIICTSSVDSRANIFIFSAQIRLLCSYVIVALWKETDSCCLIDITKDSMLANIILDTKVICGRFISCLISLNWQGDLILNYFISRYIYLVNLSLHSSNIGKEEIAGLSIFPLDNTFFLNISSYWVTGVPVATG